MRTVTYRLVDLIHAVLKIGREGENEYTRVQFDCKKVFDDYPSAIPALTVVNPSGTAYPAVITRDGDYVIWDVTDSDLTMHGDGKAQLTFTENGVVVKSCIAKTRIDISIEPNGTVPDPVQNWIDNATEVLGEVENAIPPSGTTGQVLAKKSDADYDLEWVDQSGGGGGGGTSNYNELSNKPQIGGVTLSGNKSLHDLGAASEESVSAKYTKPGTGIPSSDMASAVQTSLGKADTAYQLPSGGVPSSDMASAVQTSLGKADTAYQVPSGGIPASDMASAVQTSLGKADSAYQKPGSGIPASDMASGVIPVLTDLIDDTAGDGDTNKVWSADKTADVTTSLLEAIADKQDAPSVAGSSGQAMMLDNSGNPVWQTPPGGMVTDTVTGTTVSITGQANHRYLCGTVTEITITPPQTGMVDVMFTAGSSCVLSLPNTVKLPDWFDATSLEQGTVYEINIMDGVYGVVGSWT